ncbi:molecular chaperone Hsp90 [Catenulispora pinisilvae]|uniref:molecular chaperone Hsp90 n=1 Tax=Catenulispora pinisilvae TaxID=2705253 RepID=UPI001891BAE5|nr:molecular chaperone Hsp90 [Catenulispora pinisilvae]
MSDPFETAATRSRVLEAWVASPVRFREDANLEEDLVLGGYRDRVVVELAQNAADAALRAGVSGRLRLTLTGQTLTAANVGAPLDADGVTGLSTLRASGKVAEAGPGPESSADPTDPTDPTDPAASASSASSASSTGTSDSAASAAAAASPVGRFGVGFAAVLAVCDEPSVLSRDGSVRFSAADARREVERAAEGSAGLRAELTRRGGRTPILRLPFAADERPPQGFDTAVVLPLRDDAARKLVATLLAGVDDALLLALPTLAEIVVDVDGDVRRLTAARDDDGVCTITDGTEVSRWRTVSACGQIAPELLTDRPVEERARPRWALTWAVPCDAAEEPRRPETAPVFHGPTPTDEPLGLPALLIATLPLDPTRRRLAPGALTDFLLDRAADAYAELVRRWPSKSPGLLRLVPGPIADGPVDAELRRRIVALLAQSAILPAAERTAVNAVNADNTDRAEDAEDAEKSGAEEAPSLLIPRNAVVLTPNSAALVAALEAVIPGLLPAGFERDQAALTTLGVRGIGLGDVVEAVAGLKREPSWWAALYSALNGVSGDDPLAFDALSALSVPLADGRTVRGPRGTLRPATTLDEATLAALTPLGLRVIHPQALGDGARLLERLGAQPAEPRVMLADPAVLEAVEGAYDPVPLDDDAADPLAIAEAVLALVRAAGPRPGERFGLGRLLLPEADGGLTPANELLVPDSALAGIVDPELYGFVDPAWVERWGSGVLHAAGVPDSFPVLRDTDVLLDPDTLDDELTELEGFEDWAEHVEALCPPDSAPVVLAELAGVIGLETVRPEAWPQALELLARTPALRQAVLRPAQLALADGGRLTVPSATAWWLSRTPVLAGKCPADLLMGEDTALAGLYDALDPADAGALANDFEFLTALGVKTTARELLAVPGGPDELLDRLADPDRPVSRSQLTDLYCTLAEVPADQVCPPDQLRATLDGELAVAEADEVVVVDAPDLLPLLAGRPYLPIPLRHAHALADLLDLDLASEVIDAGVDEAGQVRDVPDAIRALLPDAPGTYVEHDDLILADGTEVDWRVADGVVHTSTFDGLARGLAWAAGRWEQRHLVSAMLAEPERTADLLVEVDFE